MNFIKSIGDNSLRKWWFFVTSEEFNIFFSCPMYSGREREKFEWELKELFFVWFRLS